MNSPTSSHTSSHTSCNEPPSARKEVCESDERRARFVSWLTIGWNVTEAVVALSAAVLAASPALLGFGLDSVVESLSSLIMIWRFQNLEQGRHREALALKLVGSSLLFLASFIAFDATRALWQHDQPEVSHIGIGLAIISIILMPLLARWKRRIALDVGSAALHADATQTDICWLLALILLAGVGLNALFGWWWADPVAALFMVPLVIKEGVNALRGHDPCCG